MEIVLSFVGLIYHLHVQIILSLSPPRKIANVCIDARNIELLKDLCNDKRTQLFAIKRFVKLRILGELLYLLRNTHIFVFVII